MSRFVLCFLVGMIFVVGCKSDPAELSSARTFAELRTIKGEVSILTQGASRTPFRRDRLVAGDTVKIPQGGLTWMRRDGGATWLIAGAAHVTLQAQTVKLDQGRAFIDTEQGQPVTILTPEGQIELSNARASVEIKKGKVVTYVLRGSARAGDQRAKSGELLTLSGKKAERRPAVSWEDWTGGLGTADPTAAPAPYGIGTVGARPAGDKGSPRSSLVIERLEVKVTIDQDLAFTEVDQTFVNPSSETVEGIYRFRTPLDATLSQFAVDRDGTLVWGRVKESKAAKATYESHVYQGSTEDPALLSWQSPGVYSARLYPIHGGERRRVVTRYSQWLSREGKNAERRLYVYPMAAEGAKGSLPRIEEMSVNIDVSRASATEIRSGMDGVRRGDNIIVKRFDFVPQADLAVELFDDGQTELVGYRAPHTLADEEIPEGKDADFAREVEKSESDYVAIPLRVDAPKRKAPGVDLAVVVDTSAATEHSALAISRSLAGALLAHLGPQDRAVLYAGDAQLRPVADGSDQFAEVTPELRKTWLHGLSSVQRGGATDLGALITEAANQLDPTRVSAVVYIGDGTPSVGEVAPKDLRERLARLPAATRIIPVAVGSQSNVTLLDQIARGAPMEVVEDAYGAARAALRILEVAGRPTWLGATLDLGPGVERVLPKKLPPLSGNETIVVVGRRSGSLPTEITLKSPEEERKLKIRFSRIEDRGDLRRRWGAIRLSALMDEGAGRATLVDLSERYGLVSPFTSLYVPTRAETQEDEEEEFDEEDYYAKREERRQRWKPWSGSGFFAGLGDSAKQYEPPASAPEMAEADSEGGTGTRAKAEETVMEKESSPSENKRYAVKGPLDSPHLARQQALREARDFGMVGALDGGETEEEEAVLKPAADADQRDEMAKLSMQTLGALGAKKRPRSASAKPTCAPGDPMCSGLSSGAAAPRGNAWGDQVGDALGSGGLGLKGIGKGGGGRGESKPGSTSGQGFGSGYGRLGGTHQTRIPKVRMGATNITGKMDASIVRRVVRQNFGRFRMCYEQGLARNPKVEGRVAVRFVIGTDGSVSNVSNGGSDLPDSGVVSCVISAFYGLSFPEPESGVVKVTYPLAFSPGHSGSVPKTQPKATPAASTRPRLAKVSRASMGRIGHAPIPCGPGADLPFLERKILWRERLAGQGVTHAIQVYRAALRQCEASHWRERVALLVLMVDQLPKIPDRVELWRKLRDISPAAADAVYRFMVLRVRTAIELRELHAALGFMQAPEEELEKIREKEKDPKKRLTLLRLEAEKYPDDSELALRVLEAYEDAGDEAGGRAWARKLRVRVDATSHLRTSVGEYYLRLSKKQGKKGALDEAEGRRTFGEIVEYAPEDPLARRHLGDLLSAHGWYEQALRQYETLARLTPDDATVQLLLARAAQGTGKTERAVRLAEQAASTSAPDSGQPVTVAAHAFSSVFLADARLESKDKDERMRLRGRARRLAAEKSGAGNRVVMTWSHPELRPVLWTNALGTMMPSPDNLPLLRVAEAYVPGTASSAWEVRLDPQDAERAGRLELNARIVVLIKEGQEDEKILRAQVSFRDGDGKARDRIRFTLQDGTLKEVRP